MNPENLMPASPASIAIGWPRERLIRALQRRAVRGAYLNGRWYVERSEVARLAAESAVAVA